jgi:probable F420-dependent oxidoreductase
VRFWQSLIFAPPAQLGPLARCAEELGFEGVVLPDHVALPEKRATRYPYGDFDLDPAYPFLDPWPAIAAMAAVTHRLRFATYVYVLPMRDPFSVAKTVATAAILSNDRVVLGAGVGWLREEIELLGHDFETRGRRTDEMLEVLRQFWERGEAELHGEFYDFGRVHMQPAPRRPIPVYVGGHSDAALRRAARCDGWMGLDFPASEIPDVMRRIRAARRALDRERAPFDVMLAPREQPDRALCRELEAQGVTSILAQSPALLGAELASLDAKRRFMERFAQQCF